LSHAKQCSAHCAGSFHFPAKNISFPGRLEELALTPAQILRLVPHPGNTTPLPARLKTLGIFLQAPNRYFEKSNQTETTVPPTAEWLLDNFYLIEQALRPVCELPFPYTKPVPPGDSDL